MFGGGHVGYEERKGKKNITKGVFGLKACWAFGFGFGPAEKEKENEKGSVWY